jgi:hypothetical protein
VTIDRRAVVLTLLLIATLAATPHAEEKNGSPLTGGGTVSGPPAPAVPAIAATPEPAAKPAVPGAPVEPGVAAREEPVAAPEPGPPRKVNLWPLFQYESDPATRTSHVSIFGPLFEYRADADRQQIFVRPLISISQSRVGHDDDVRILGPLLVSHWGQTQQMTKGLGGLFTYRTTTSADGRTLESQDARLLPVYFYAWEKPERSGRLSIAPFYADLDDFLGYEHVDMGLFPAYLHVKKPPSLDRYYYPFPLISRDGPEGSGYRLWPFPLRDREGNRVDRMESRPPADAEPECQTHFPLLRDQLTDHDAQTAADPS